MAVGVLARDGGSVYAPGNPVALRR